MVLTIIPRLADYCLYVPSGFLLLYSTTIDKLNVQDIYSNSHILAMQPYLLPWVPYIQHNLGPASKIRTTPYPFHTT